jgi:hypothetical protein
MAKRRSKQDAGAKQDALEREVERELLRGLDNVNEDTVELLKQAPHEYEVSSTRPYATRPMTDDECEAFAYYFLKGGDRQIEGRIARRWPKGENEALGREALIRILASEKPFPESLRQAFIDLLDLGNNEPRKFVFKFRSQNWPRNMGQDTDIASYIAWHLQNQKMINPKRKPLLKLAFDDARRVFGLKNRTIFHAWARHKERHPTKPRCG